MQMRDGARKGERGTSEDTYVYISTGPYVSTMSSSSSPIIARDWIFVAEAWEDRPGNWTARG